MFTTPGASTRDDPTGLGRQTIMEKSYAYRMLLLFLRSRVLSGLTGGLTVTPPDLVASRTRLNLAQATSDSPLYISIFSPEYFLFRLISVTFDVRGLVKQFPDPRLALSLQSDIVQAADRDSLHL